MKNLTGKVVAITGAGSGIGSALARELATSGVRLALSDIEQEGLDETAGLVGKSGVDIHTEIVDVSDYEQVVDWADKVANHFGEVDVVINNAGVGIRMGFTDTRLEDLHWVMNINFWGVVHGSKAFLPYLLERPEATLCNISSVFGLFTAPQSAPYCSSKAAVRAFTQTLAQEYAMTGLKVCCVYRGGVKTNIASNARLHAGASEQDRRDNTRRFERDLAKTTPEQAAKIIIAGILRGNPRIIVGTDARFYDAISRVFPETWQKLVRLASDHQP